MSKEEMIQQTAEALGKLYFEDVSFIRGLVLKLIQKKGV